MARKTDGGRMGMGRTDEEPGYRPAVPRVVVTVSAVWDAVRVAGCAVGGDHGVAPCETPCQRPATARVVVVTASVVRGRCRRASLPWVVVTVSAA